MPAGGSCNHAKLRTPHKRRALADGVQPVGDIEHLVKRDRVPVFDVARDSVLDRAHIRVNRARARSKHVTRRKKSECHF